MRSFKISFPLKRTKNAILDVKYTKSSRLDGLQVQHCSGIHCYGWRSDPMVMGYQVCWSRRKTRNQDNQMSVYLYFTETKAVPIGL